MGLTEEAADEIYVGDQIAIYIETYEPVEYLPNHWTPRCFLKAIVLREGEQKVIELHLIFPNARLSNAVC